MGSGVRWVTRPSALSSIAAATGIGVGLIDSALLNIGVQQVGDY